MLAWRSIKIGVLVGGVAGQVLGGSSVYALEPVPVAVPVFVGEVPAKLPPRSQQGASGKATDAVRVPDPDAPAPLPEFDLGTVKTVPASEPAESGVPSAKPSPAPTKIPVGELEFALARGTALLEQKKFVEANREFLAVYQKDPRNPAALMGLGRSAMMRGDFREAYRVYTRAGSVAGAALKAEVVIRAAEAQGRMGERAPARKQLSALLKAGSLSAENELLAHYLLGYFLVLDQWWSEAENHLYQARQRILALPPESAYQRELLPSLQFYLGEIYTRFGYDRFAIRELWGAARSPVERLKRDAWMLEEAHDHSSGRASLGLLLRYDANAMGISVPRDSPVGISGKAGLSSVVMASGAAGSSPTRHWRVAGNLDLVVNQYFEEDLSSLDTVSARPSIALGWWDLGSHELGLRYDYAFVMMNRKAYAKGLETHGPSVGWTFTPDYRQKLEATYSYRNLVFGDGAKAALGGEDRAGVMHVVSAKGSMILPDPDWQPYLRYSLEIRDLHSVLFRGVSNQFEVGTDYNWEDQFTLHGEFGYAIAAFSDAEPKRSDDTFSLRAGIRVPFLESFLALVDAEFSKNASTLSGQSYSRFLLAAGVVYGFSLW